MTKGYWRARLLRFDDGRPTLDSLTHDADGATTVTVTMRFGLEQLPPPMDRLHSGSLRIVQIETWHATDDGVLHGTIAVDAPGAPVSGHGELSVTPSAGWLETGGQGHGRRARSGDRWRDRGIGRRPARGGIRDIHEFTDAWIVANDHPDR